MAKVSRAQERVLRMLAHGWDVRPGGAYEVHQSLRTGAVHYVVPKQAWAVCEREGWIADGTISDAGQAALRSTHPTGADQ